MGGMPRFRYNWEKDFDLLTGRELGQVRVQGPPAIIICSKKSHLWQILLLKNYGRRFVKMSAQKIVGYSYILRYMPYKVQVPTVVNFSLN